MDRLDAIRTLVAVADYGSFSEAARKLHFSPTVASRAVSGIEDALGVTLLRRTTRSITLTPEGSAYVAQCRDILQRLSAAERSLADVGAPQGELTVNAPEVFGRLHMLPIIGDVMRSYPRLHVELILSDQIVDLAKEGVDVAVRAGMLSDSALVAVKLLDVVRTPVASPLYLAEHGIPTEPHHLLEHRLIGWAGHALGDEWRFGPERSVIVRFKPKLLTNNVDAAIAAAIQGVGIARPLSYQVEAAIAERRLVPLLQDFAPPPIPINLVFLASRKTAPNVRALVKAALKYFRLEPGSAHYDAV